MQSEGLTAPLLILFLQVSLSWGSESGRAGPAPTLCHVTVRAKERSPPLPLQPLASCNRQEHWPCPSSNAALMRTGPVPHLSKSWTDPFDRDIGKLVWRKWEQKKRALLCVLVREVLESSSLCWGEGELAIWPIQQLGKLTKRVISWPSPSSTSSMIYWNM